MSALRGGLRCIFRRTTTRSSTAADDSLRFGVACTVLPATATTAAAGIHSSHTQSARFSSRTPSFRLQPTRTPGFSSPLTPSRIPFPPCRYLLPNIHARTLFSSSSVITEYVNLPPDYDDAKGLPFRRRGGDLLPSEVAEVFGPGMSPAAANRLLRILHGRRVAGSLDDPDPAIRVNTVRYPQAEIDAALAYLRQTTPVDELINAGLRAEDELAAMEEQEARMEEEQDEKKEGENKEQKEVKEGETKSSSDKWRARLFKEAPGDDVYGEGAFDRIRARNRAKHEVRERQRAAEEAARRAAQEKEWAERGVKVREVALPDGQTRLEPVPVPREMSPRLQQYALAATSPLEAPPNMSSWQRLWPSYATVLALVGGGSIVASVYGEDTDATAITVATDGHGGGGSFLSTLTPSAATVLGLVGANVAVFVLWRVPPLWRVLNRYMIVVPATPRPLSLLGAMFSHQKASHLLANTVFLYFIGMRLHDEIGRAAFLEVYFSSGLLAFLASMTNIVLRNNLHLMTLGASGAIYGIATAYFMLHKFEGFKILGLPPDPYNGIQGLGFIGLMLGLNLLTLRAEKQSIDVVTHFAGMAVGAVFGEYWRIQKEESLRAATEGRPPRSTWQVVLAGSSQ